MVLSNAERQARYRTRLKDLATRGTLSPTQAAMLADTRRRLRDWRRLIVSYTGGRSWFRVDGIDQTDEHIAMLRDLVRRNEALVAQFDPDGHTEDGNVEIGEVSVDVWGQVIGGRWVSYRLDSQGRARELRLYDNESIARVDARQRSGYHGRVGADHWSIEPAPRLAAYALIQEMPNGWWKALISGWGDLPEQYGLSEDRVISEIGAVAREYLRQRTDRGIPTAESIPASIPGWKCVAVSIEL